MLTPEEVRKVALLARLDVSSDETDHFATELSKVLDYVEKIGELDLVGVSPTSHVVENASPLRADQPTESLPRETALEAAPDVQADGFHVPSPGARDE